MSLSHKLTAALAGGILLVMGVYAVVQIRHEVTLFRTDLKKNARVGRALKATIEEIWRAQGEARARELVEEADDESERLGVRVVPLEAPGGAVSRLGADDVTLLRSGVAVRLVREDAAGDRLRHTFLLLDVPGDATYVLELFESLRDRLTFIRMNRIGVVTAALAVTLVCGLIVVAVASRFVSRPIERLCEQAHRIGAGDLSQRLALRQRDEIGELARELDAMCDLMAESSRRLASETEARIAALEQLRHSDRLATVGKLAAGVAHQLGTPLNVIAIRARMVSEAVATDALQQSARVIAEQADRMTSILRRLLDFSRRRTVSVRRSDLVRIVARTLDLIGPVASHYKVRLERHLPDEAVPVDADEAQLQQALANIMLNGVQAMEPGGRLSVRVGMRPATHRPDAPPGDEAFVTIEDEGPGIDSEQRDRLFEPFFTTKPPGQGTGLGLSVAEDIVHDHGGRIVVDDGTGGTGAAFTVCLAVAGAEVEQAS